jgi:hypothetical protein
MNVAAEVLIRLVLAFVAGGFAYFTLTVLSGLELSQNVVLGISATAFLLVLIFGMKIFRFVMELVDTIW